MIIAFDEGEATHLVLIEAKGATSWTNKQLRSKLSRISAILADATEKIASRVAVHFLIVSPVRPIHLKPETPQWPKWFVKDNDFHWMRMTLPPHRLKVTQCDENAKPKQRGDFWMLQKADRREVVGDEAPPL